MKRKITYNRGQMQNVIRNYYYEKCTEEELLDTLKYLKNHTVFGEKLSFKMEAQRYINEQAYFYPEKERIRLPFFL